jgi:lysozyme
MAEPAPVPPPPPTPAAKKGKAFAALVGAVGLGMATSLVLDTKQDEGEVRHAYRDLGSVWTICSGSTHDVAPGEVDTAEECDARTAADLLIAYGAVTRCAPGLKDPVRHQQLRAVIRFHNNTGRFCVSSARSLMLDAQWRAGCDALLRYDGIIAGKPIRGAVKVRRLKDGRYFSEIRGLMNRRAAEHLVCVAGL